MLSTQELDQIGKGWAKIMVIWIALISSLVFYLVICKAVENQIPVSMEGSQLEVLRYALFGISGMTLVGVFLFRKFMMKQIARPIKGSAFSSNTHPSMRICVKSQYSVFLNHHRLPIIWLKCHGDTTTVKRRRSRF